MSTQAWSTKQAAPTTSIELRANVCCVKYNPNTAHEIAVGSADHNVHLYDLRKPSAPVHIFGGNIPHTMHFSEIFGKPRPPSAKCAVSAVRSDLNLP